METTEATEWIPAEDFDTGLTADDWKEILEDKYFQDKKPIGLITLWLYYKYNAPCSYTELAKEYGRSIGYYIGGMTQFNTTIADKFKKKIHPFTDEKGKMVYWYLPFVARKVSKENGEDGSFIFKLRDEVREGFDKLSEERRQEFEKMYLKQKEEYEMNPKPKIWVIAAGNNGDLWDDFVTNNRISIGWDKGDLTNKDPSSKNLSDFKNAKIGDFVFSRKGAQKFIGFGRIDSEYKYEESKEDHKNTRSVTWLEIWTEQPKKTNASYNEKQAFIEIKDKNKETDEIKDVISKYMFELNSKEKECLEKLQKSRQIILTGAPGTGKSYAAREIANRLTGNKAENIDFVQFHPSMDYTDFVEGLRPIKDDKGQIGFERQDGIFKAFCKKALDNWLNYQKTPEQQTKERNLKQQLDNFLNDAIENETEFRLLRGTPFEITGFDENKIFATASWKERNLEIKIPYKNVLDVLVKDLPLSNIASVIGYFERKKQWQCDSYTFALCNEIRKRISENEPQTSVSDQKEELENFVFIIDEINRGDISKIFGELFFAIDPSYRGEKGKITTQYQNLVESDDLYAGGFYIPENVYIIGTMNDIDRDVESMDFAIRRRFTWIEVNPDDTQSMLDSGIPKYAADAKERMGALNKVIFTNPSLGKAYQIGAAYFLRLNELNGNFDALWAYHLEPLLREYLRGDPRAEEFLDEMKKAYGVKAE